MSTTTEQLVVALEARINSFEKNMAKASGTATRNFGQMERRSRNAGKRMEEHMASSSSRITASLASLGKGAFAGIIGAATIGGLNALVGRLGAVAESVANIGSEAKRAGVTTRVFQEWSHVTTQARIPIDALIDGLKELNIRGDEFAVTGKGGGAEAFARLGFSASDLARRLRDPSALMLEIIGRMERLDKASQIRIADEVFGGTAGERFVELLGQGQAGIGRMVQEAHDFGLVLDDEMIAKADEIDRRFKLISSTIGTNLKGAVISVVDAMSGLFDGMRDIERQQDFTIQTRLSDIFGERQALQDRIAEMEEQDASPLSIFKNTNELALARNRLAEITAEAMRLKDILDRRNGYPGTIEETGDQAQTTTPLVRTLATELDGMNAAGSTGAAGITSFADAIRSLKNEIPGLTDQLAELDAKARIETAYRSAIATARDQGSLAQAERLRDEALSALAGKPARDAAGRGMLDLIGYAEGTDKGRGYNETLGYGAYTGGPRNLVTMTLDEVDAMQTGMLRHPANGFNSSAAGRYQIVQKTLRGLRSELGLSGDEFFDAAMQDRLAQQLLRRRGNDVAGLRNEWEGLRRVDADTIRGAYDGTSVQMPAMDTGLQTQRTQRADEAKQQVEAYSQIIAEAQRYKTEIGLEQQALGMTAQAAARLRYEQDLLSQAQRAGIELTPQQRSELQELAAGMAQVEAAASNAASSQTEMAQLQGFLGNQVQGFFSGLLSGSMTVEQALARVVSSLAEAALQAALLGTGPLASLFGGSGGGLLSLIGLGTGKVRAFASGGHVRGPGTGTSDSIPAMLSDGEYVINAKSTRENRALLEAINSGRVPRFAAGGPVGGSSYVGATTRSNTFSPVINVKVEGSAGASPEAQAQMGDVIAKQIENGIRAQFSEMVQNEMRPQGSLSRKRLSV